MFTPLLLALEVTVEMVLRQLVTLLGERTDDKIFRHALVDEIVASDAVRVQLVDEVFVFLQRAGCGLGIFHGGRY